MQLVVWRLMSTALLFAAIAGFGAACNPPLKLRSGGDSLANGAIAKNERGFAVQQQRGAGSDIAHCPIMLPQFAVIGYDRFGRGEE